jgi:hypothetical protein
MKKEVWKLAKPTIVKSFLYFVVLPVSILVGCMAVALSVGDKNALWQPIIAVAVIGILWSIVGLWKFIKVITVSLNLSKRQSQILIVCVAIIVIGIVSGFDAIMENAFRSK